MATLASEQVTDSRKRPISRDDEDEALPASRPRLPQFSDYLAAQQAKAALSATQPDSGSGIRKAALEALPPLAEASGAHPDHHAHPTSQDGSTVNHHPDAAAPHATPVAGEVLVQDERTGWQRHIHRDDWHHASLGNIHSEVHQHFGACCGVDCELALYLPHYGTFVPLLNVPTRLCAELGVIPGAVMRLVPKAPSSAPVAPVVPHQQQPTAACAAHPHEAGTNVPFEWSANGVPPAPRAPLAQRTGPAQHQLAANEVDGGAPAAAGDHWMRSHAATHPQDTAPVPGASYYATPPTVEAVPAHPITEMHCFGNRRMSVTYPVPMLVGDAVFQEFTEYLRSSVRRTIVIRNLDNSISPTSVARFFTGFGAILRVRFSTQSQKPPGHSSDEGYYLMFIEYLDEDAARKAIRVTNRLVTHVQNSTERTISVELSRKPTTGCLQHDGVLIICGGQKKVKRLSCFTSSTRAEINRGNCFFAAIHKMGFRYEHGTTGFWEQLRQEDVRPLLMLEEGASS